MVEFSPATREARVRFPASARSPKFVSKTLSLSLFLLLLFLFSLFFFPICPHTAHLLAYLFSMNCKQNLFVLNLVLNVLVYISVNLLSYQGVFVFFLAMFCVASPIECASQRLFGS